MTMKNRLGRIARILAAFGVVGLYWIYGIVLLYSLTIVYRFVWMKFFKPAFYLPALCIVVYLYLIKKRRGMFLESLAFLMALSMVMLLTVELIILL